ncbi:MAG: glutathione S-transferase [Polyangiaceae bacterium]|nr:glutathione S-transferase [Polyangiaceae bacterium]
MTELLGLSYSPWTEKARWALDARRIPYTYRPYQPLVGEPALRVKLRRLGGRVTVPVLTTDEGRVIADSTEIARWADGRGEGPRLFPAEHEAAIQHLVDLSERALDAGRALALGRVLRDPDAAAEMVPRSLRRALGPLAAWVGAIGIVRTRRKYGGHRVDDEVHRRALVAALDELQAALGAGRETLLGSFSFADIAAAQALVFVAPPATGLTLGAASRRSFADAEMQARYADLVAFRDRLYEAHRAA